jgi:hypothetical protein
MSVHICEFWYCSDDRDYLSPSRRCRKHAVRQILVEYLTANDREAYRREWRCPDHVDQGMSEELVAECKRLGIELPE